MTDPAAILRRQAARESSSRSYARSLPIVPVRANGMVVEGADGRRYLDCLSGAGALALGHNHPAAVAAIRAALDRGEPMQILDLATPLKDEFTSALFDLLPPAFADGARIQFCGPAGTDAVEAALKLACMATGRRGVLSFGGAYHGMTAGALAASGTAPGNAAGAAGQLDGARLPYPYPYRCPFGLGGELGAEVSARYVRNLLDDPKGGLRPPAAMLVEVVQGEGGVVPAPDSWMRAMRQATADRGVPLIVDEVQTGVGRTGHMWAVERSGVLPDILVLSKAIGGGLPLAVIVYRAALDIGAPGSHAGTFRGNQLAMAAGTATLRLVAAEGLAARAGDLGERMLDGLRKLAAEYRFIGDVRGRGLMLGAELVRPDSAADALGALPRAPRLATAVRTACLDRGLIVELGGREDAVLRLLPPLTMTDEQAASVLDRLADACAEVARAAGY